MTVHQDVHVYAGQLDAGTAVSHPIGAGRHVWLHVARGSATVGDSLLREGDGAAVSSEPHLSIRAGGSAELLLFDLA